MAPMRNVYNLITDGFKSMGVDEMLFIVAVNGSTITIKKKDREEKSTIVLNMDGENLRDFDDTNDIFTSLAWNRFCQVFEREMSYPDDFYTFLQALTNHANILGTNAWMT